MLKNIKNITQVLLPKSKDHCILGIGPSFIPSILDTNIIDKHLKVSDKLAISSTKELARTEGIFGGFSTGAIIGGIKEYHSLFEGKNIFTIFPESGN